MSPDGDPTDPGPADSGSPDSVPADSAPADSPPAGAPPDGTDDSPGSADGYVHDASYVFEYADASLARTVAAAVGNEVGEIDDDRSRTTLDREGRRVRVEVAARDLVALRAATNTWLGLVDVAERTAALTD